MNYDAIPEPFGKYLACDNTEEKCHGGERTQVSFDDMLFILFICIYFY